MTIEDTSGEFETEESKNDVDDLELYGNTGSTVLNEDGSWTIIYYVTESEVDPDDETSTVESLVKHTVTNTSGEGGIYSNNSSCDSGFEYSSDVYGNVDNLIYVEPDGELILNGGTFANYSGCRAIYNDSDSSLTVDGTIIANSGIYNAGWGESGGGIYAGSSTVLKLITGAVLNNNADEDYIRTSNVEDDNGGGIFAANCEISVPEDFYICGNRGHNGGGIYSDKCKVSLDGGVIVNNRASYDGGWIISFGRFFYARIASNVAGDEITDDSSKDEYYYVAEAGGIRINVSEWDISKGYITNNITNNNADYGGGIFVSEGSELNLGNAIITNNTAAGYGGGIATCPTGYATITGTESALIYGNSAMETNMSAEPGSYSASSVAYGYDNKVYDNGSGAYLSNVILKNEDGNDEEVSIDNAADYFSAKNLSSVGQV